MGTQVQEGKAPDTREDSEVERLMKDIQKEKATELNSGERVSGSMCVRRHS
jgi:hypothetical protein